MKLVNLEELIKYHPYHITTFASFADITTELLKAALEEKEELTSLELRNIARYTEVPIGVIKCPTIIKLFRNRERHVEMMRDLYIKLYIIWEATKAGSKEGEWYMQHQCRGLVNLILDFQNKREVTYCRYLGVKEEVEECLHSIRVEGNKPRGITA